VVNTIDGASPTLTLSDGTVATYDGNASNPSNDMLVFDDTLAPNEQASTLGITAVDLNGASIQDANGNNADFSAASEIAPCYCRGTLIRTVRGEVPVEALAIGDRVSTFNGEARPIKWIGRRQVVARYADPLRSWPVRIKANALAHSVPSRDLLLSPDHAILLDGVLIQAGALVNASSIVREAILPERFTYYHIELDDHSLILAENTPAETFVDNVDRMAFDNWPEYEALYPEGKQVAEMPYPRAKSHRQVPRAIRERLAARAATFYGLQSAVAA
jgi:hypothetical protein